MEVLEALRRKLDLPRASASATRRNVIVSGVDLNTLIEAKFEIQGVRLAGVEQCSPCYWMNSALGPCAETWLKGRGGLRARILKDGVLHRGSPDSELEGNEPRRAFSLGGLDCRPGPLPHEFCA